MGNPRRGTAAPSPLYLVSRLYALRALESSLTRLYGMAIHPAELDAAPASLDGTPGGEASESHSKECSAHNSYMANASCVDCDACFYYNV